MQFTDKALIASARNKRKDQLTLHKVFAQYFQCKFRDEFVGYWSDAFHRMLAGASRMKKIRVSSK